jgi:protein-tyrosine phosphatase
MRKSVTNRLRRLARALRHAPDRVLHPRRRRRALRGFEARGFPRAALFVCLGNVCRSPYAAAAYAAMLPAHVRGRAAVDSAGLIGPGRPAPEEAILVAGRRGHDLSGHRSKLLDAELVRNADLIIVMDARQQREICRRYGLDPSSVLVLGDLDPEPIDTRAIRDPWGQSEAVFDASYARIDRCVAALVEAASSARRPMEPAPIA